MKTAVVVLTQAGLGLARRLRDQWPGQVTVFGPSCVVATCAGPAEGLAAASESILAGTFSTGEPGVYGWRGPLRRVLPQIWGECDALVAIMALGIVVRLVGPLARDKRSDPAVVVVDDAGQFAISVLGGHAARANELARAVAGRLGSQPVITTCTDVRGLPAPEQIAQRLNAAIERSENLTQVAASIARRERVAYWQDAGQPDWWSALGPWPETFIRLDDCRDWRASGATALLVVSDRTLADDLSPERVLVYRPQTLVAGVGCRRGATCATIAAWVEQVFALAGLALSCLACVATVTLKAREPGLLEFAATRQVPLIAFPPGELAELPGIERSSARVRSLIGIAAVSEPSALRAAGAERLLVAKQVGPGVTVAVARRFAVLPSRLSG